MHASWTCNASPAFMAYGTRDLVFANCFVAAVRRVSVAQYGKFWLPGPLALHAHVRHEKHAMYVIL